MDNLLKRTCLKTGFTSGNPGIIRRVVFSAIFVLSSFAFLNGQTTVSGTVTDATSGDVLPGVNVLITGTTTGITTDLYGKYTIEVSDPEASLTFSYIGYISQTIAVGGKSVIDVSLAADVQSLDEVVVIGYGVQKKKLNTGANLNIEGEMIQSLNTSSSMDALKGISPGLSITQSNGQPGASNKVYIRGVGTTGRSNPLYIVDGVSVGDIDYLSPADIESIDVLKDAASAGIYGSRAANGVILVTTKRGQKGKMIVSFDSYVGQQNMYRKPEMLNAQQYAEIMTEAYTNSGRLNTLNFARDVPDWARIESGEWTGTNWLKEFENKNALVHSNTLNITGGSEKSVFSLGASYYNKEGVLGKNVNNTYKRLNLRLNSDHALLSKSWGDIIKIGESLTFTNEKNPTLRTGNMYWNDLRSVLSANPLLPMYADDESDAAYPYHYAIRWSNFQEPNPIANMELESKYNTNNNNTIIGNAYIEIQPVKNLRLRSSFGINNGYGSSRHYTYPYDLSDITNNTRDQLDERMYSFFQWTSTTTLNYTFDFLNDHNLSFLVGNEDIKTAKDLTMDSHKEGSLFGDEEYGYLDNFPDLDETNAPYSNYGGRDEFGWGMISYFGRFSYNYKEKYLFSALFRADASSKFTKGNRWGYFPSVSAGWVISSEPFMENFRDKLYYLKLRFSWGKNGNQDIDDFAYLSSFSYEGVNYFFGPNNTVRTVGSFPARVPNPGVHWENSEQTDIGLDMNFLNNKLQFSIDWYEKNTGDWLVQAPSSATDGTAAPFINGGNIRNRGVELLLKWTQRTGNFNYNLTGTLAYNKNEVTDIPNEEGLIQGPANQLSQGTTEMFRAEEGYPIGYFWGYETDGILQNDADVEAYVGGPDNEPYFNNSAPGDVRFVDQNNDGEINDDDKVMLGKPHPDFIFGLQLYFEYKGIYISALGTGMAGLQVAKSYRSFADSPKSNYTTDIYERWHGEGTSNEMPRVLSTPHRNNQWISDLYIEDADFFRMSNLTLGYDLKNLIKVFPSTRIYISGQNLFIITKYSGMDPEVGYAPEDENDRTLDYRWGAGIDLGLYPQSRIYMVGLSINF